jgi:heat shock protein HslJ
MPRIRLFEVIAAILILSATFFAGVSCAKANDGNTNLEGVTWVLKSFGDPASLTPVVADKETTLTFVKDKKEVNGNGGVNGYGGKYEVDGNKLTVDEVIHTLMASTNEALNIQESAFFRILESAVSFKITDNQLTITGSEGTLVLVQK